MAKNEPDPSSSHQAHHIRIVSLAALFEAAQRLSTTTAPAFESKCVLLSYVVMVLDIHSCDSPTVLRVGDSAWIRLAPVSVLSTGDACG